MSVYASELEVGVGIAGIENYDAVNPTIGFTYQPFDSGKFKFKAFFNYWSGDNQSLLQNENSNAELTSIKYTGNAMTGIYAQYLFYEDKNFSSLVGPGIGIVELTKLTASNERSVSLGTALSINLDMNYRVTSQLGYSLKFSAYTFDTKMLDAGIIIVGASWTL